MTSTNAALDIHRPAGLRHGYHANLGSTGVEGLHEAGDQWAGSSWAIGAHRHNVWELYLQLEGSPSTWIVADCKIAVGPRQLLLVPPKTEHELLDPRPSRWHFYFASIDSPALLRDFPSAAQMWMLTTPLLLAEASRCVEPFLHYLDEVTSAGPYRNEGLRSAAQHLLISVSRLVQISTSGHSAPASLAAVHPAVARGQHILRTQYAAPLSVGDVAAMVGLSPAHFASLFSREVGVAPAAFRRQVRLDHAERMLKETTLSVSEIGASVGFASAQHLATSMRQHRGLSPSQVRLPVT